VLRKALYLRRMLASARRTPAQLAFRQRRLLEKLVRSAAMHVPLYRQLFAARGIDARGFRFERDFQRLPVVDKTQLRAAGASARSALRAHAAVRISTSGSSGEPFEFLIDPAYDQWRKAQYLRPYLQLGRRWGDSVLRLTSAPRDARPLFGRLRALRETALSCGAEPGLVEASWQRLAPQILQGYPSSLRALAHHCLERGRRLEPAPRLVFTDSELLLPDTRALLEQQFAAPVLDIFGTFETDNIGFECRHRAGFHITTDSVLLEILRDGVPVPDGEEGEIVVTVLHNRTSPFIRYNLRDLARLAPRPCACGLPFPLLTGLQGRANDLLLLEDGAERSAMHVFRGLRAFTHLLRQYQLRQLAVGRFELLVVPASPCADADLARLRALLAQNLGGGELCVRVVAAIPPGPSGKWRAFVQELSACA
jgi:phenylacetate-CoA ligase